MKNFFKNEKGQSLLEFALILPIIIIIAMLPVDFFRYINTKILLSSAASECICNVKYEELEDKPSTDNCVYSILNKNYSDKLNTSEINYTLIYDGTTDKKDYDFYIYSSDKANERRFWDKFKKRPSNYTKAPIKFKLSYDMSPITFWGSLIFGKSIKVETKTFAREVYVKGYEP